MMATLIETLITTIIAIAKREVMPRFLRVNAQCKADGSRYSDADIHCQQALVNALSSLVPCPVLGEEMPEEQQQRLWHEHQRLWVVDPLDGTSNFLHGLPHFALSVALMEQHKPSLAVIYNPVSQELFYAQQGQGSYLGERRLPLQQQQHAIKHAIAAIDFQYLPRYVAQQLLTQPPYGSLRHFGACTLDWCYLAAGRYDLYAHAGQHLWDYAAGSLILSEAGGQLGGWDELDYWQQPVWRRPLLAANNASLFKQWQQWFTQALANVAPLPPCPPPE